MEAHGRTRPRRDEGRREPARRAWPGSLVDAGAALRRSERRPRDGRPVAAAAAGRRPRSQQPLAAAGQRRDLGGGEQLGAARSPRSPPDRVADGRPRRPAPRAAAARPPSPTAPCAACARRGSVTPWSTPYRWPSGIASTWPPLRSALLTTTSKTAIRRSAAVSSWTSETPRSWLVDAVEDVQPARRAPRPRGTRSTATCSSSGSCQTCTMPGPVRAVAQEGVRDDVPAQRLRDDVRRDLAGGQRAVGEVPERPLPRDRLVDDADAVDLADEGGVGRRQDPAVERQLPAEEVGRGHSSSGRRLTSAEAVGPHAQVAVGVDRAAAERAAGAARPRSPARLA